MSRIVWDRVEDRFFETGLDRAVLYIRARQAYPDFDIPAIEAKAVPWNGMTAVDESGAGAAKISMMDGRPYLILPTIKEFGATVKAFTYPDEFGDLIGMAQATPGMYLDSQLSDSFDFTYRTKVGNVAEGIDHGYKIHLVYNAVVTPQSISRETLSDQINPTELAWDILAVPVPVAGYMPTAHIVIDSRNTDPAKLSDIEDLLYGNVSDDGRMPEAQEVFDILTYGDTIVIIDHGDGSWSAKGSYKNIYMIGDGIFQIDNVNAVDHGDGSYTISDTP